METKTIYSMEELELFVQEFVKTLSVSDVAATVVALSGDLGAGKTTFVQQVAKVLGVAEPITSPTFTVMKRYETDHYAFKTLLHMDAYRLESEEELGPLRFDELLSLENTLFCIEWAERISSVLPKNTIKVRLNITNGDTRTIQVER